MTDAGLQVAIPFGVAESDNKKLMSKVFRRLIVFLYIAYFFSYLDRINISFAALSMNKDLALTATMFGFANTLFYFTYMLFEVPSNLLLARFGARIWLARIMVTWGLASTATMFAVGPYSLYITRALVGLAEAGFFPGLILYMSYWFPAAHRARVLALLMTAMPTTFMIGSPVSGLIMQMHGALGLEGWRWLFLIEGLPSIVLGIVTYFILTDRPKDAKWLTPAEQNTIQQALDEEKKTTPAAAERGTLSELLSLRVLLLSLASFCLVNSLNTYATWTPQIIREFLKGAHDVSYIGWLGAIPPFFTLLAMPLIGFSSDRLNERLWHTCGVFALTALGWVAVIMFNDVRLQLAGLVLVSIGAFTGLAMFWAFTTPLLSVKNRPASIGLISSAGILGSATSPTIVGFLKDLTASFNSGLWYAVALLALGILILLIVQRQTQPKAA